MGRLSLPSLFLLTSLFWEPLGHATTKRLKKNASFLKNTHNFLLFVFLRLSCVLLVSLPLRETTAIRLASQSNGLSRAWGWIPHGSDRPATLRTRARRRLPRARPWRLRRARRTRRLSCAWSRRLPRTRTWPVRCPGTADRPARSGRHAAAATHRRGASVLRATGSIGRYILLFSVTYQHLTLLQTGHGSDAAQLACGL